MSVHIGAKAGEIAEKILLPGDPLRAKYIAETYLEDAVCFNTVRNMLGYTGMYKGQRLSVMGTGMGISSANIYVHELINHYGVKTLVRIGTAGGIQPQLQMGDVVIASGACTTNDFNHNLFPGTYCPLSDFDLVRGAYYAARRLGIRAVVGSVCSEDLYYDDELTPDQAAMWRKYGVLAEEMEAAGLLTLAKREGVRALAMVIVAGSEWLGWDMSAEEEKRALDNMILIGLETLVGEEVRA